MKTFEAVPLLSALAHETRLEVFRLLVRAGPDGLAAGSPDRTDSAAIDEVFTSTPIIDGEGDPDFPFYWTSTTHKDGIVKWEWAVYVAFGEAKGYGMSGPP